jgi:hypothetical protein
MINKDRQRSRYVLPANTDDEELLFDKLEIIRINMKDSETRKPIFKNRREQGIQILKEYVQRNEKFLTIQSPVISSEAV